MQRTTTPEKAPVAPAFCPACGSRDVTTTSKTVDASTYWRCHACGEVWNVDRREAASRFVFGR
jgi:transposase-like protein